MPTGKTLRLEPDDPIFTQANELSERLREDLTPEEALERGVIASHGFLQSCGIAEAEEQPWGWVLRDVFDLPVGWATAGADPEGAARASAAFDEAVGPVIISVPAASTFLALPVVGHDESGVDVVGAMMAIPLIADADPDDNILVGAVTGAGIVGVQMENSMRARAARRALQFAHAASSTQRMLVEPTALKRAMSIAIDHLSRCDALEWGSATLIEDGNEIELAKFGDPEGTVITAAGRPVVTDSDAWRASSLAELPVSVEGSVVGRIKMQSRYALGMVERDTLASIGAAVSGTVVRFHASETIETLRRTATRRLVEAQERERSMVAADIHDGVLQQLGATAIRLELAQSRVELRDFDAASAIIADGANEIRSCARELRALLMELRPQVLDDNGLNAALSELARHVASCEVTVDAELPEDLASDLAITIFRIVQEALTNIDKHAHASHAQVTASAGDGQITITVSDDGVGYEGALSGPSSEGSHFGLLGMRERAQMFGGTFTISGESGGGTVLRAVLPIDRPEPDEGEA